DNAGRFSNNIRCTDIFSFSEISLWEESVMRLGLPGHLALASLLAAGVALSAPALAQEEHESVGRGWPMADQEGHLAVGAGIGGAFGGEAVAARNGEVPEGVEPLERDIFTSDDFYQDADLWSDPRYFRCNSPMGLESQ